MQGGDFVYGSAGITKEGQQPDPVDKKVKKGGFQLSKILPSPTKKGSVNSSKISTIPPQDDSLPDIEDDLITAVLNKDGVEDQEAEVDHETDEEGSDGDWYVIQYLFMCLFNWRIILHPLLAIRLLILLRFIAGIQRMIQSGCGASASNLTTTVL